MIVGVRFHTGGKVYHFDPGGCDDLAAGDFVVVDTARGRQIGQVVYRQPAGKDTPADLKPILWVASGKELALRQRWEARARQALELARQKAREQNLEIKLAAAEYTLDGKQLTLLYVTGTKEEVQTLQRLMGRALHKRVEMRQIGPRDYARMLGGYGACGEPRCCTRFLADFAPISIRMGKEQGISLTPSEITGMCGRLRCCLAHEYEMYVEESKNLPRRKARVRTPHGEGRVVDLLPLKGAVVVEIEERRIEVPVEEVELL